MSHQTRIVIVSYGEPTSCIPDDHLAGTLIEAERFGTLQSGSERTQVRPECSVESVYLAIGFVQGQDHLKRICKAGEAMIDSRPQKTSFFMVLPEAMSPRFKCTTT